jgi:phosphoribosyl 1,2-cyclic phosphodiesterase
MRITPLASGSKGNSLLLCSRDQRILVDIGLPLEDIEARLEQADTKPASITAICITHRHRDHCRGIETFSKRHRTPIYGTRRTLRSLCNKLTKRQHIIPTDGPFAIAHIDGYAVSLSHDAPETVAFRFDDGESRFAIATDLGSDAGEIREVFTELDALLLEFNYDDEMLARSADPTHLRERVASDTGHLSNAQAARLLSSIDRSRLRHVWVGHVSARNNRPELAIAAARQALGSNYRGTVRLAEQDAVSPSHQVVRPTREGRVR